MRGHRSPRILLPERRPTITAHPAPVPVSRGRRAAPAGRAGPPRRRCPPCPGAVRAPPRDAGCRSDGRAVRRSARGGPGHGGGGGGGRRGVGGGHDRRVPAGARLVHPHPGVHGAEVRG